MKKVELEIYKNKSNRMGLSVGRIKATGYGEGSVIVGPDIQNTTPVKVFELTLDDLYLLREEINTSIRFLRSRKL